MSILKSTKTGFKYYYPVEWVKNNCEMKVNGDNVIPDIFVDDNGIKISIPNLSRFRLMSKLTRKEMFTDQELPIEIRHFISPDQECTFRIDKIPENFVLIKEINCNVLIGKLDEKSFSYLKDCKINGYVSSYYFDEKQLNDFGVHPNWNCK